MPMYMDIHEVHGATAADVAKAHIADVKTQGKYGVEYHKYWFNESNGKIFCLCSRLGFDNTANIFKKILDIAFRRFNQELSIFVLSYVISEKIKSLLNRGNLRFCRRKA